MGTSYVLRVALICYTRFATGMFIVSAALCCQVQYSAHTGQKSRTSSSFPVCCLQSTIGNTVDSFTDTTYTSDYRYYSGSDV